MSNLDTIGGLRSALTSLDGKAKVFIDGRSPTALSSYRGYYDHLAIERDGIAKHERTEPGNGEVRIKADPTVAELIKALDLADGEVFEGYKGGQFHMHSSTDLWVSENGCCDQLRVSSITATPGRVDLATTEEEI